MKWIYFERVNGSVIYVNQRSSAADAIETKHTRSGLLIGQPAEATT